MKDQNYCWSSRKRRLSIPKMASWISIYVSLSMTLATWKTSTFILSFQVYTLPRHFSTSQSSSRTTSNLLHDKGKKGIRLQKSSSTTTRRTTTSMFSSRANGNSNNGRTRIPEDLMKEIKEEADIISVIEAHDLPQFKRLSEDRATAICPFHDDSHPSLNIDNNKGLYKCFACGAGGDVFNFVREYDYLQNHKGNGASRKSITGEGGDKDKKMSYPEALSKVINQYCSESVKQEVGKYIHFTGSNNNNNDYKKQLSPAMRAKMDAERKKKERILLANSAAADFYAKLLITSPAAGGARAHLFERGVPPAMVRTFALGYAPDAYFSPQNYKSNGHGGNVNKNHGRRYTSNWGKGSLVERLEELGLEPKEIVEAGLATVTSAAKNRIKAHRSFMMKAGEINATKSEDVDNNTDNDGELRYSDLIDRFRGRLMVPIFDASGDNVLGFGGRELILPEQSTSSIEGTNETKSNFRSPKYLNSPESLVFEKKNILFGLHTAEASIREQRGENIQRKNENKKDDNGNIEQPNPLVGQDVQSSILIVEGYFDAISLYGVGITEVTASMGAALTYKQLEAAANVLGQGRIVICLDNDDAGIGAVERLSAGNQIWDLISKKSVEVVVASLPDGIKDPGEFVEVRSKTHPETLRECFQEEILENVKLWSDWYTDQLISKFDEYDSSSFASICDVITTFLSRNPNAADRTKQAYETAGKLARQISTNETSISLRVQLESDLLGMASKKAKKSENIEERKQAVDKLAKAALISDMKSNTRVKPSTPLHEKQSNQMQSREHSTTQQKHRNGILNQLHNPYIVNNLNTKNLNRRKIHYDSQANEPPVTPHFTGFQFNPTDAAWLGISEKNAKASMLLTGQQPDWKKKRQKFVYFNSNQYLGNVPSIDSEGVPFTSLSNQLLNQNADKILLSAESRLLKAMIHFGSARLAMKAALANRENSPGLIEWSSPEREWLFHCLTESPGHEPLPQKLQGGGTAEELMNYLQTRSDAPDGAFATELKNSNQSPSYSDGNTWFDSTFVDEVSDGEVRKSLRGSLDEFFDDTDDVTKLKLDKYAVSHDERAELTVQEAVATMLKAAAMKRLSKLKEAWKISLDCLAIRKVAENAENKDNRTESAESSLKQLPYEDLTTIELEGHCKTLGEEVLKSMSIVRELSESLTHLGRRLLDYCVAAGAEGRNSRSKQEELAKMLEEHIASLPDDREKPGYEDGYIFGSDEFRDDIDHRYGGIQTEKSIPGTPTLDQSFEGDETLFQSVFE